MREFQVPIYIEEQAGLERNAEAIRIGVPLARGLVFEPHDVVLTDNAGRALPHQAEALARWSDRSIKWLLVEGRAQIDGLARTTLFLRRRDSEVTDPSAEWTHLAISESDESVTIDTGAARIHVNKAHSGLLESVTVGTRSVLAGTEIFAIAANGVRYAATADHLAVESSGPFRVTVAIEGRFKADRDALSLYFRSRLTAVAGSTAVSMDFQVWNPRAAVHPGGTWDLGDPGSITFKDLTLRLRPAQPVQSIRWSAERPSESLEQPGARPWYLYQDSSGGEQWDSPNHVDARSRPTVAFRGYRIGGAAEGPGELTGLRATPLLTAVSGDTWIAGTVEHFWQNFPKALRWREGLLEISLFPGECRQSFELQGGEKKRHTVFIDFGVSSQPSSVAFLQHPVLVCVDPRWVEESHAISWFSAKSETDDQRYADYVSKMVEGQTSLIAKREIIDEYGWRNFGDLYGDHEAVHHSGPEPFVSHYNNQYDFVYGAFLHFERTGDPRWRMLLDDAARHLIDIDIYHTTRDKAAFNGGLFWHTDHYLPARTCTHRTYSRSNGRPGQYGGGPSNEHNYTSGLLHYYYLTADPEAAAAVRELADWVFGMDDGARTLFAVIDDGPTGAASKTLEATFHHAGRGAGNSVNALLDAFALSGEYRYLAKAEEIIQRCIHPDDSIADLRLDDPEHRWSYLVFLQVLGKYLAGKRERGETDYAFQYARESLLHYARWVATNEVPYKDVLHKVEIPTETWPAHDVRKSHLLCVAAGYAGEAECQLFVKRGRFFFDRCLTDLLGFTTAYLTRPQVILCVYGLVNDYVRKYGVTSLAVATAHNYFFGRPTEFVPQRARLSGQLKAKARGVASECARIWTDKLTLFSSRFRRIR